MTSYVFSSLLFVVLLTACGSKQQTDSDQNETTHKLRPDADSWVFTGAIENPVDDKAYVIRNPIYGDRQVDTLYLDSNGSFVHKSQNEAGFYQFQHGREVTKLFLQKGKEVHLKLHTGHFDESLQYEGSGAGPNNYLARAYLLDERQADFRNLLKMPEDSFLHTLAEQGKSRRALLDSCYQTGMLTETQHALFEEYVAFQNDRPLSLYPSVHARLADRPDYEPSDALQKKVASIQVERPELLGLSEYRSFLQQFVGMAIRKEQGAPSSREDLYRQVQQTVLQGFEHPDIRDLMLFKNTNDAINQLGIDQAEPFIEEAQAEIRNEEALAQLNQAVKRWRRLAEGQPAPIFEAVDIKGHKHKIDELRGKYVYLDVWATWCGPCRREIPDLDALRTKYADNEKLAILSVSIDEDKKAWEKMVKNRPLEGHQWHIDGAWDSPLVRQYMIQGIPRFILIDPDGKIIQANAPRPSGNIEEVLTELEGLENPGQGMAAR